MTPLAQLVYDGKRGSPYHIIVRKGRYASLDALKGKQLAGSVLFEPALFFRQALGGRYSAQDFELIPTTRTLRYLRKVGKDKLDAMVLDHLAYKNIGKVRLKQEVVCIEQTTEVPHPLFVAFEGIAPKPERAQMQTALVGLCRDPAGKQVCENFEFDDFTRVNAKDLPAVR